MNGCDEILNAYDKGAIGRRKLLASLAALLIPASAGVASSPDDSGAPIVRARTINHVSINVSDVARSKAFYQRLTGLPIREEGPGYCEFRCEGAFLGLYSQASETASQVGIDHFCLGIESYQPRATFQMLKMAIPEAHPTLEYQEEQVYVRDPDGVRVQFSAIDYKR
jgi:catechol 2,3-dioxygenase-like lactoylglutathione lyase family enzyme